MFLGYIKPGKFNELNAALIELQDLIPKIHFASLGISLNRDVATIEKSDFSINYELWLRNGVQSLSYFSPYIDDDVFSAKVLALKRLMLSSLDASLAGKKDTIHLLMKLLLTGTIIK